jgi:hypothetical protein
MRPRSLALAAVVSVVLAAGVCAGGCTTDAPTYATCSDTITCANDADQCYRVLLTRTDGSTGDASMCSRPCTSHADCPADGLCLSLVGDPSGRLLCYARCASSDDCFSGLACTATTGAVGDPSACLP